MIVRVVDNVGRPVLGLKPEDFRVRVGSKPDRHCCTSYVPPLPGAGGAMGEGDRG